MDRILFTGLVLICVAIAEPSLGQDRPPIIDMHLHSYDDSNYYVAPGPKGMSPATAQEHFEATYQVMRDNNIVVGVVSNSRSSEASWMSKDVENRFLRGFGWFRLSEETLDEFRALARAGEVDVFGEVGAFYSGMTLADPYFEPYLEICEELGIPVAIHTGSAPPGINYRGAPKARLRHGDPLVLEDVLVKYPNLKIYLMHAGEFYYEHALSLMLAHRQVYAGLGAVLWVVEAPKHYGGLFLLRAKEFGLLDRVMFGSDQMVWPQGIEASLEQLNSFDFLTDEDKRDVLYNNAARFLDLSEEDIARHHQR